MKFKTFIIVLLLLGFWFIGIKAEMKDEVPVPPRVQIPILFKILTYDRNFEKKVEEKLVIGILYDSRNFYSEKIKDEFSTVLDSLSAKTIKRIPFTFVDLNYNSQESLEYFIELKGINAFYLAPGGQKHLKSIIQISQKSKILTTTGITDYIKKGISLGIGLKENKPEIWINLDSAKAEGSDFDANFLKLCKIIRKSEL